MRTVFKYRLTCPGLTHLLLPKGAKILNVQQQGMWSVLWALVDTDVEGNEERTIETVGTGWEFNAPGIYIATFQSGPYVWHAFDVTPTK